MPKNDDADDADDATTFDEGFATLALPMGGVGTPRLPVPADPAALASAGAQLVRLRDVLVYGMPMPCFEVGGPAPATDGGSPSR